MGLLCTPQEVAALLHTSFTPQEEAALTLVIEMVEGDLASYINRPIAPTTFLDERATVDETGHLPLANSPVQSVEAVRLGGTSSPVSPSVYTIAPGRAGLSFLSAAGVDFDVDYTAGVPAPKAGALRSAVLARCARIAAKVRDVAMGVNSLSQEGYVAAYATEGFTDQELRLCGRRRKRVA